METANIRKVVSQPEEINVSREGRERMMTTESGRTDKLLSRYRETYIMGILNAASLLTTSFTTFFSLWCKLTTG